MEKQKAHETEVLYGNLEGMGKSEKRKTIYIQRIGIRKFLSMQESKTRSDQNERFNVLARHAILCLQLPWRVQKSIVSIRFWVIQRLDPFSAKFISFDTTL